MMPKYLNCVLSVIVVILCIASTQCDVSHILGAESPVVDPGTLDLLTRNIGDYLTELQHGGSPQMRLQQIFSASKQTVTGTLYNVDALLATPDGPRNCKIRVLEKPWIDFCKVSVKCENGGQYEVTFNPSHNIPQYVPPTKTSAPFSGYFYQKPQPVTYRPNPFVNQLPTTQVVPPYKPVYQPVAPTLPPFKPQTVPTYRPVAPTLPPFKYQPAPTYKPVAPTLPPFQFKPPPVPVYKPQPVPTPAPTQPPTQYFQPPPTPAPTFPPPPPTPAPTFSPPPPPPKYNPLIDVRRDEYQSPKNGVPNPVFSEPPELNILPFDQLPQGPALDAYLGGVFDDFMVKYKRQYINEPHEQEHRLNVFKNNFNMLNEYARSDRLSAQYSVTEFSDLTQDEFSRIMGFTTDELAFGLNSTDTSTAEIPAIGDLPEKYDQRDENLVTSVKFQGDCGACWAFVTVAVIEGLCAKKTKKLQEFSEQSLIDCDKSNFGCKGGVPPKAMKHIAQRGGLELKSVYPFVFAQSSCKFNKQNVRVKVSGTVGFKKNDEEGMAKWLMKNGPILVGINAAPLQHYKSGVLNPTPALCNPKKVNHGVTLIGFGVEVNTSSGEKLPYWIVKNQWGTRWGENGYFRIARGKNACGIALWANSVKLANIENNCLLNGA